MRGTVWKKLSTTAARLAGTAFAAALILGSIALPNAARAGAGFPVFCGTSGVAFVAGLCDATSVPGSPNTFTYTFNGGAVGGTGFIPLLDPSAIVAGSFMIGGVAETPDIITGAAVATDWGSPSFADGKSIFDSPAALIDIALPGALDFTEVTFDSFDAIVTGPIRVAGAEGSPYFDPPLPGAPAGVPEPGSLALLGSALAVIGLYRQRRKRS